MRYPRTFAVAFAAVALSACETATKTTSLPLAVTADATALTLQNPNAWPVFYLAINPASLADYALCMDPTSCPKVAARGSARVSLAEVAGYQVGMASVQVSQWRLERSLSGDYEATDMRSVTVSLR
jgi:hypothetical protein